jgi:hypothetical protein
MLHIQREQFTPRRAKFYAAEVLLALEYFHKNVGCALYVSIMCSVADFLGAIAL